MNLEEELSMLDVLDRLGGSGVEPSAVGSTGVGGPALLGVKGPAVRRVYFSILVRFLLREI